MWKRGRKAQSNVIAVILVILIVIILVILIWNFYMIFLAAHNPDENAASCAFDNQFEIEKAWVDSESPETLYLQVKRISGNSMLDYVYFVVTDDAGQTFKTPHINNPEFISQTLETRGYSIPSASMNPSRSDFNDIDKVELVYSCGSIGKKVLYIADDADVISSDEPPAGFVTEPPGARLPPPGGGSGGGDGGNNFWTPMCTVDIDCGLNSGKYCIEGVCTAAACQRDSDCVPIDCKQASCSNSLCSYSNSIQGTPCDNGQCAAGTCLVFNPSAVSSCGELINGNTLYTLNQSVSTNGTCFKIQADGITLNLNGHTISGDADSENDYGVDNSEGHIMLFVINGTIKDFASGVYNSGTYTLFSNLRISSKRGNNAGGTGVNNMYGIYIDSLGYVTINNCTILSIDSNGVPIKVSGIYSKRGYGVEILNSRILGLSGATPAGISLNSGRYSLVNVSILSGYSPLVLNKVNYSEFSGLRLVAGAESTISLALSANNTFRDFIIPDAIREPENTLELVSASTGNNLTNVSYSSSGESVDSTSSLTRKWYYQARVTDGSGNPLAGAGVDIKYNLPNEWSYHYPKTGADGYAPIIEFPQYRKNGAFRVDCTGLSIHVHKDGATQDVNLATNALNQNYLPQNIVLS